LPLQNPKIQVREEGDSVAVAVAGRPRYVFPRGDCALLPIPNTTVEMLAQYLAGRVCRELTTGGGGGGGGGAEGVRAIEGGGGGGGGGGGAVGLRAIGVEVEENFGPSATYRESL